MNATYLEDVPADTLQFNYGLVAAALASLLCRKSVGATVVGIHGQWGSGKTTLLRAIRQELERKFPDDHAMFIEFNAWKYQERQALWRALILRVLGELRAHGANEPKLAELEASLYRSFAVQETGPWQVNWRTLIVEVLGMLLSLVKLDFVATALKQSTGFLGRILVWAGSGNGKKAAKDKDKSDAGAAPLNDERLEKLGSVLERTTVQRQVAQVQSIEQFLGKFAELIAQSATSTEGSRRVFVFIDDLDRCLPESALEIFEAIKLFLDVTGCGYVIALDRDVIRKGLIAKYSQQAQLADGVLINADEYIEKTISVSYDLPRLSEPDVRSIIGSFELPLALDATHQNLIIAGLGRNPRRVKRFMNTLSVHLQLAQAMKAAGEPVDSCLLSFAKEGDDRRFDYFLKLALLAYRYSGLFSLALQDESVLGRLQTLSNVYAKAVAAKENIPEARDKRNGALQNESALLMGLRTAEEFWALMRMAPSVLNDPDLTKSFITWFRQEPRTQAAS